MKLWWKYSLCPWVELKLTLLARDIVWWLPKWVIRWSVVRAAVNAAGDSENPGEVKAISMLEGL